jgi:hypothetical protein
MMGRMEFGHIPQTSGYFFLCCSLLYLQSYSHFLFTYDSFYIDNSLFIQASIIIYIIPSPRYPCTHLSSQHAFTDLLHSLIQHM